MAGMVPVVAGKVRPVVALCRCRKKPRGFAHDDSKIRLMSNANTLKPKRQPLYTPEERARRDASRWTLVQAILAPLQFVVFLISLYFVLYFLATGEGYLAATISIVIKTLILYTIMVTGAIWEKEVFGHYLFAKAFFWEDFVSMFVILLHTVYMASLIWKFLTPEEQMWVALAAYAIYVINAAQFLYKLRLARLSAQAEDEAAAAARAANPEPVK